MWITKKIHNHQQPKLQIKFDENKIKYFNESDVFKKIFSLKTLTAKRLNRCTYWQLYRISIYNPSKTLTIKDVSATLTITDNCPEDLKGKLPMPLHFMHDNTAPFKKKIDISPLKSQFVDVIMWQLIPGQEEPEFSIYHVVENIGKITIPIPEYDNKQVYKIRIDVTGENAKCESRSFLIGLKGEENVFNKNWFHPI